VCGAVPPLPRCDFMAWCLVKHTGKFNFNFTIRHWNAENASLLYMDYRKVNLFLCMTKHHAMKTHWGSGGIAPRIL
jgi:hypothetical protein